ncbi:MAG TPA: emp24/gp25L/p24 family protein [Dehalococcoidia bacterium]|nr:emp24/gp25L/p24 family protein [Dehalococcoidia bacterium]
MKTLLLGIFVCLLLGGGVIASWVAMNYFNAGGVGTPAHAGALSNGHPEKCTNVNFSVKPRSEATRSIPLDHGTLLRGTFEADGGFGRVDVIMRILDPQGQEILTTKRVSNYDFSLPPKYKGDYRLQFDNRYSLYTSKSIALFYCIDNGQPTTPDAPFFPRPSY